MIDEETRRLRAWQKEVSSIRVAALLDRWGHMSNDVKGSLRSDDETFCKLMDDLERAWQSEPPKILQGCREARRCLHDIL